MVASPAYQTQLMNQLRNESFTMTEFLEYVLWTRDLQMVDPHWNPISETCNPCLKDYNYVLHVESLLESNYLFHLLNINR